ncbi:MAG: hypothetical protein ABII00_15400 [Elusimicrobiota bacterium]
MAAAVWLGLLVPPSVRAAPAEAAAPEWLSKPYHGFAEPGKVAAGVGVSEVKPDMEVTRAVSSARAAQDLIASMKSSVSQLRRDYETQDHNFTEFAAKGFTVRTLKGFCTAKLLLRDYASEVDSDDEGMTERAMLIEFPPSGEAAMKVYVQEYLDASRNSLWTRMALRRASTGAPPAGTWEGFKPWETPKQIKVRDYHNRFSTGQQEVHLEVRIGREDGETSWLEESVDDANRVGELKASGTTSKFVFNTVKKSWEAGRKPVDLSPFLKEPETDSQGPSPEALRELGHDEDWSSFP